MENPYCSCKLTWTVLQAAGLSEADADRLWLKVRGSSLHTPPQLRYRLAEALHTAPRPYSCPAAAVALGRSSTLRSTPPTAAAAAAPLANVQVPPSPFGGCRAPLSRLRCRVPSTEECQATELRPLCPSGCVCTQLGPLWGLGLVEPADEDAAEAGEAGAGEAEVPLPAAAAEEAAEEPDTSAADAAAAAEAAAEAKVRWTLVTWG